MQGKINKLEKEALSRIKEADSLKKLENLRILYLGRKGELTKILRGLSDLPTSDRPKIGALANKIKGNIEKTIINKSKNINQAKVGKIAETEWIDITAPGTEYPNGHLHPITQFIKKAVNIFISMGFEIYESPEIDFAYYNFDVLNVPKDHPARDVWDTFYIDDRKDFSDDKKMLLRTHTSNAQVRAMENRKPPVRIVVPGRCYRNENIDTSHEATFYQLEGFVIDKGIRVSDLLGTLNFFARRIFGNDVETRARPHFYPFTEPSIDFDVSCIFCKGYGCSVCKKSGWLEVMPCGMIHPNVLRKMNVDPKTYSGFAFGFGIDRLMMLYYGIDNIRLSYSGDLRFLEQF